MRKSRESKRERAGNQGGSGERPSPDFPSDCLAEPGRVSRQTIHRRRDETIYREVFQRLPAYRLRFRSLVPRTHSRARDRCIGRLGGERKVNGNSLLRGTSMQMARDGLSPLPLDSAQWIILSDGLCFMACTRGYFPVLPS